MRILKVGAVVALGLSAMVLLFPFKTTVLPAVSVTVVDEAGTPTPNVLVKQEWTDIAVENERHVDSVRTNEIGVATFPERTGRAMLLKRLLNVGWRIATQGVHASIRPSGVLTAYSHMDPNVWGSVGYNSGAWPHQIKLKRWDKPPLSLRLQY